MCCFYKAKLELLAQKGLRMTEQERKEILSQPVTEEQRQEFIRIAREQGHNPPDDVKLIPVDPETLERLEK